MLEFLILLFAEIGVSAEAVYFAYSVVQAYGAYAAVIAYSVYGSVEARRKAAAEGRKQRADYNSNLSDRAITTLQSSPPFRVVYGRAIVGGDILGVFTSDKSAFHDDGTAYTKPDGYKHVVVHIASHAVHSIRDTLISGIRVGTLSGDGWATNTALGTGKNYTVASATCFVGTTSIPIVNGTGTILTGDEVSFTGDDNRYPVVTGVTGPGTIVIAYPGLLVAAPVGAEVVLGNEFCKLKSQTRIISIPAGGSVTVTDKISSVVMTLGPPSVSTDAQDAPIASNATVDSSGLVLSNPNAYDVNVTCIAAPLVSSVRISYHLGSATQTVDTFLNNVVPNEWTTNHRLQGLSYAVITFDLEEQRFQGGIPQLSFDTEGKEILDTRTSIVAYSTNPALIIRDFLTAQDYGFQCKATDIDVVALNAAANACDVTTNYQYIDAFGATISKSEALFTCNGSFTSDSSRESVLNDLCESMAGFATYGAQWSIQAGAWTTPVMTLNDADLDGQIDIVQAGAGLDTLFNGTRGTYIPAGKISAIDFLPYQNASFLTADSGVELWNNVTYPYTDSKYRCEQLARIMTERNRYGQVITYPAKLKAWPLVVGDRVTVNSTEYGFVSKTYRVTDWQFTLNSAVGLILQEETASVYDMVNATVADLSPASTLPNPNIVETLTGLTAVSGTTTLKRFVDGTIIPQVKVSWNMPKGAYLSGGQGEVALSWRRASGSTWDTIYPAADDRSVFIGNVVDLTTIIIEAYFINSNAAAGNPMTITHLVLGKSQKPSNVTSLTYTAYPGRALVKFAACPDLDYSSVCVQVGSWSDGAAMFFEGDVSEYSYSNAAGTYTLYFKFRDATGNLSTTVASITVAVPATLVANLAALTGAENLGVNLINAGNWFVGTGGNQTTGGLTNWPALATSAGGSNSIVLAGGPDGSQRPVWYAISGGAAGTSSEGGFVGVGSISVDPSKSYRVVCWVYTTGTQDGSVYLGIGGSQVDDLPSGSVNANPYFQALSRSGLNVNRWYLFTGFVLPSSYTGAQLNMGGVYDGTTGQKIAAGLDYRWHAGQTTATLRAFQYYTGGAGRYLLLTGPRFDLLDGSEPSIAALMTDAVLSRANSAYSSASAAQTDATAANTALANIASDSILSPSEKPTVKQDYDKLIAEQSAIDSQASAYNLSEKVAYDVAVTALTSYLSGLSGWNTIPGGDVVIVGTVFRANFAAVYSARQTLLNAIATYAAASGVSLVNGAGNSNTIVGNAVYRTAAYVVAWHPDDWATSRQTLARGAYCSFVVPVPVNCYFIAGLTPNKSIYATDNSVFGLIVRNSNLVGIRYGGTEYSNVVCSPGDVFTVAHDGVTVKFFQNGTLMANGSVAVANLSLAFFYSSVGFGAGNGISNIQFGPLSNNDWSSLGGTGKAADNATVGAPSGTYVGSSLAQTVEANAANALANAASAQTSAGIANTAIANIASDSILSPSEKPSVVQDYTVITSEQAGIDAQATAYSVTTEKTTYDNAVSALTTYLSGLSGWNTVPGSDVAIVGTTFRSNFAAVYTAKQVLLNKIAAVAGTVATWAGIPAGSGKAADNATVGAQAGTNLKDSGGTILSDAAVKNSSVSISPLGVLQGAGGGQMVTLPTIDLVGASGVFGARDRNDAPSEYAWGTTRQFKVAGNVGVIGGTNYCLLETIKQYTDSSGGGVYQYAYQGTLTYRRYAADPNSAATGWGAWTQDLDRNLYTGDLNATVGAIWGSNLTGQPSDAALLNAQQQWSQVLDGSGTRPANNATVGAQSGVNLKDFGGNVLFDAAIKNSSITVVNGVLTNTGTSGVVVDNSFLTPSINSAAGIVLVNDAYMTIVGNSATKTSGDGNWNGAFHSKNSYTGGAYVSFMATPGYALMVGLNTDPLTDSSYSSIDFAIYCTGALLYTYESGSGTVSSLTYDASDVLSVTYDGSFVRYFKNGSLIKAPIAATITLPLFVDSSFATAGGSVSNLQFGPMSSNAWSAISGQPSGIYNSNISIASNGVLSGAGGGGVTIGGLGYNGSLNATQNQSDAVTNGSISTAGTTAVWGGGTISGQPSDAALLNAQQQWSQVLDGSGTRPANNATVGAQAGVNLKDSGGVALSDVAIKNSLQEWADVRNTAGTRPSDNATQNQSDATTNGAISAAGTTANWAGIPAGSGKPADNATKNTLTRSYTAPTSPTDGDIWLATDSGGSVILQTYYRTAGAWSLDPKAITLSLSQSSCTLVADSAGVVDSFATATTTGKIMIGATDDTANWTWTRTDGSGVTSSISGAVLTVSALSVDASYTDVTAIRTGYPTQTLRFGLTKAKGAVTGTGPLTGLYTSSSAAGPQPRYAGVKFNNDGTIQAKDNAGTYQAAGNWYSPTTAGIGSSYWIKMTATGTAFSSGTVGSWVSLSTAQSWLSNVTTATNVRNCPGSYLLATSSTGSGTIASGAIDASADTT